MKYDAMPLEMIPTTEGNRLSDLRREMDRRRQLDRDAFAAEVSSEFPVGAIVRPEHLDGGRTGTVIGHADEQVEVCWHADAEKVSWQRLKKVQKPPAVTP